MKRVISTGILSFILLVSLAVFAACGSRAAEEPTPEPGEEFAAAVSGMRQARSMASVLGAFTEGTVHINGAEQAADADESEEQHLVATGRIDSPLDFGDVPTRTQFSLQLDSVTVDRSPMHEVTLLRPGLDFTVYNNRDFYYIEGGISLFGLPFPVVNIGIDGSEVSAKVPLLYERYFAFNIDTILDDLMDDPFFNEFMYYFAQGFDQGFDMGYNFAEQLEAATEAFQYALDIENLLLGLLEDMLAVSQVEVDGDAYVLIIPAAYATEALETFLVTIVDALAAIDLSFLDMDVDITDADWDEVRDVLGEIYFTQDVTLSYVLYNGNLLAIEIEGILGAESDDEEVRILVAYDNNSGDHVGDIAWVFEMETMNAGDEFFLRFEYTSTLDTTNGYDRHDSFTILFDDNWESFDMVLSWYLTRTLDNRFSAGLEFIFDDGWDDFDLYLFAQGAMAFGDDYFNFDLDRLGLEFNMVNVINFEVVLSMSFSHEAVSAADVPTISPADQFFVMDADDAELDRLLQQLESNAFELMDMLAMFGF